MIENTLNPALRQQQSAKAAAFADQESAWVAASQHGDVLAFNRLVLKWEKSVFNLALRMLQDQDEAADTAQDVFLSAFRNIRKFRKDARFSTWIYRIAVNHCITRLRKQPPGIHLSLDDDTSGELPLANRLRAPGSHEEDLVREESRKRVRTAMSRLPADQRAVVELKFFQDLTFEEISEICEVPLSTIKSRLYAGLEILKLRLGDLSVHGGGKS